MPTCAKCGAENNGQYQRIGLVCPKCLAPYPQQLNAGPVLARQLPRGTGMAVLLLIVVGAFMTLSYTRKLNGDGPRPAPSSAIQDQVVADAIDRYRIVERKGGKTDLCVQAGLVAAALLQAKREAEYGQWRDIEAQQCKP